MIRYLNEKRQILLEKGVSAVMLLQGVMPM